MSNIYISKLGVRYEVVYYYKQKIVNWDFVAPSAYECLFSTIPESQNKYSNILSYSMYQSDEFLSSDLAIYITDESYRNNIVYYELTLSNNFFPSIPCVFQGFTNTSIETLPINVSDNIVFPALTTKTLQATPVQFKTPIKYPIVDSLITKIYSLIPIGTYTRTIEFIKNTVDCRVNFSTLREPTINTPIVSSNLKSYQNLLSLGHIIDALMTGIGTIVNSYTQVVSINTNILPLHTQYIVGNADTITYTFSNGNTYNSISSCSLSSHTSISH